jgi:hypothetical protein
MIGASMGVAVTGVAMTAAGFDSTGFVAAGAAVLTEGRATARAFGLEVVVAIVADLSEGPAQAGINRCCSAT